MNVYLFLSLFLNSPTILKAEQLLQPLIGGFKPLVSREKSLYSPGLNFPVLFVITKKAENFKNPQKQNPTSITKRQLKGKNTSPSPAIITQKNKKASAPTRSLSSDHGQTKIQKYQQTLLNLCSQEGTNSKEKFLSFIQSTDNLKQFIKEQMPSLKSEEQTELSRIANVINEEALPYKEILKEKNSFKEKADSLKFIFETHYRHYHNIPEEQDILAELPKIILETLACI